MDTKVIACNPAIRIPYRIDLDEVFHVFYRGLGQTAGFNESLIRRAGFQSSTSTQAFRSMLTVAEHVARLNRGLTTLKKIGDHNVTWLHSIRVPIFTVMLAKILAHLPRYPYSQDLRNGFLEQLSLSSFFHDIGKVQIDHGIIRSVEPLSAHARDIIREHPEKGSLAVDLFIDSLCRQHSADGLTAESERISKLLPALHTAREIAVMHHEKLDGSGYPFGLSAEHIPFYVRIVTVADEFEARIDPKRPYHPAESIEEVFADISLRRGIHFDPHVIDALAILVHWNRPVIEALVPGVR